MSGPRRWPLHPAPTDGEALSSWLRRIAGCCGTDIEHLGDDIGYKVGTGNLDRIDLAPAPGLIEVLADRTGVAPARLRQMSVAGWVPWLLDDMDPGPDGFATYTRQQSVLRRAGKHKTRLVPSWRPWLSDRLPARACPECVAATPSPHPYQLLWAIPIVSSCPAHGCWLEATIAARGYFGMWDLDRPTPRPAPEQILTLDQRTRHAFAVGHVDLPRRRVHAGIWFRLLRTVIDELSCPLSENRPSDTGTIRQIWKEAGYPARDGQGFWRPYEQQPETVQRHTMEAAAAAIALLEARTVTGRGTHADLFLPEPYRKIDNGKPAKENPEGKAVYPKPLGQALEEAIQAAREDPAEAHALYNFALIGCRTPESVTRLRADFAELGIPLETLSPISTHASFA